MKLNALAYTLKKDKDEIYNSKNTLQRDFILFKENNEVISQNLVPGIYFIFTNDTSYIQGLTDRKKIDNNLYSFKAIEGESICSKNRAIFFENEKNNNDLFFLLSEKKNIYYAKNGINYKIIDGDLRLNISKDYDLNDLGVKFGEDCIFK